MLRLVLLEFSVFITITSTLKSFLLGETLQEVKVTHRWLVVPLSIKLQLVVVGDPWLM